MFGLSALELREGARHDAMHAARVAARVAARRARKAAEGKHGEPGSNTDNQQPTTESPIDYKLYIPVLVLVLILLYRLAYMYFK